MYIHMSIYIYRQKYTYRYINIYKYINIGVLKWGVPLHHPCIVGLSIVSHPFMGTSFMGNPHTCIYIYTHTQIYMYIYTYIYIYI